MKVHDTIVRLAAASNAGIAGGMLFGVPISDVSHLVTMICVVTTTMIAYFSFRRGRKDKDKK